MSVYDWPMDPTDPNPECPEVFRTTCGEFVISGSATGVRGLGVSTKLTHCCPEANPPCCGRLCPE